MSFSSALCPARPFSKRRGTEKPIVLKGFALIALCVCVCVVYCVTA